MKKRLFSILLVLCMALTMLPVTALAETDDPNNIALKYALRNGKHVDIVIAAGTEKELKVGQPYYFSVARNGNASLTDTVDGKASYLKIEKTVDNEYVITVVGTVNLNSKDCAIEVSDEWASSKNLTITGDSRASLSITRSDYAFALSSSGSNVTITGGVNVTLNAKHKYDNNHPGYRDNAVYISNGDLIISGAGTKVTVGNQGNDAAIYAKNIIVKDGATLSATNSNLMNYAPATYGARAIEVHDSGAITVSGQNTKVIAYTRANEAIKGAVTPGNGVTIRGGISKNESYNIFIGEDKDNPLSCKYVEITVAAPHTHTFDNTWTTDATDHWHACTASDCNGIDAIKDKAAHTPGDWIIDKAPNATEAGSKHKECTVCQYKTQTETIPATGLCTHQGTLKYTDNGDWKTHKVECTACDRVINEKEAHAIHGYHINDEAGTHQEFCNKCSYIGYPLQHTKFIYVADGDGHYKKCGICGVTTGMKESHIFENGSCTACGAADPIYVPPTDTAPVEPTPGGSVIIITPEATGPVFLSGANQTVAPGSAAAFRIDYNYAAFRSVAVDGVTLTPTDYTTWEGSTWVKLTPAYVKTLGIGTHTLSVYFDGATAATTFTVGSQPNPATGARDAVGIAAAAAVIALLGSAVILRKK